MCHRNRNLGIAGKRPFAGQCLICHNPERVDVGEGSRGFSRRLLRRQILNRTHHLSGRRQGDLIDGPRNAKIGDFDPSIGGDQQISWFHIPVNQPGLVRSVKSRCGLGDDVENSLGGQEPFSFDNRRQRLSRHEFHDEVRAALFFTKVVNTCDSLMIDQRGMAGLRSKPLPERLVAQVFFLENFDRDLAFNDLVYCLPDLTHSSDSEAGLQFVSATKYVSNLRSH